jgi:hypothetical protein
VLTVALIAVAGCGGGGRSGGGSRSGGSGGGGAPTTSAKPHCRRVGQGAIRILASGLKKGKQLEPGVYAVPSGDKPTTWVFAARIQGAGVAEWVTALTPTSPRTSPVSTHFIQAANSVAWHDSHWGSLGSFPQKYPSALLSLDSPAFDQASACLG